MENGKENINRLCYFNDKVFEIIEAKNIFNLNYKQLEILIHPKSYVMQLLNLIMVSLRLSYMIKTWSILFSTLYTTICQKKLNLKILIGYSNNLCLARVDYNKFPMVKLLSSLPPHNSLFETVIVSINDALVNLFLKTD